MIRILKFISSDIHTMKDNSIRGEAIQWGPMASRWQKDASTSLYLVNTFNKLFKALSFVSKNDYSSVQFSEKPVQKHKARVLLATKCLQLDTLLNIYIFQIPFHFKIDSDVTKFNCFLQNWTWVYTNLYTFFCQVSFATKDGVSLRWLTFIYLFIN